MNGSHVIELNYQNFEQEVFGSDDPMLVEFYSEDAYACRALDGVLEDLANEFSDRVRIGRVDKDADWQVAENYQVKAAPVVLLIQHERVVERIEGPHTREDYRQAICELISQHWVI
jgi:thioredoxin 1